MSVATTVGKVALVVTPFLAACTPETRTPTETPRPVATQTTPPATLSDCYESAANRTQQIRCERSGDYDATITFNRAETAATYVNNPNPPRRTTVTPQLGRTLCGLTGTNRLDCEVVVRDGTRPLDAATEIINLGRRLGL